MNLDCGCELETMNLVQVKFYNRNKEWNCDDFCIDYDSPFQFTNFLDNMFRSRFGTCARYKLWDQRLSKMESLVDMTDAGKALIKRAFFHQ